VSALGPDRLEAHHLIASRSSETIILRKAGDKTVFMQKSKNGNFSDPGQKLSYCSQEAQRKFAEQKARN